MSLHANGIAHCDIKPENIMINSQGQVILIDFGFAAELQSHGFKSGVVGTPTYMAPEIWDSEYGVPY